HVAQMDRAGLQYAVSDDGALIAVGGDDKKVHLWDPRTGTIVRSMTGHAGGITALAFDPSGSTVAAASKDLTIRLWDVGTGAPIAMLMGHTARINRLQFGGHELLMSVSDDRSIRLWKQQRIGEARVLRGHDSYVYAVAFTPDGSRIISGSWDQTVRVWDAAS